MGIDEPDIDETRPEHWWQRLPNPPTEYNGEPWLVDADLPVSQAHRDKVLDDTMRELGIITTDVQLSRHTADAMAAAWKDAGGLDLISFEFSVTALDTRWFVRRRGSITVTPIRGWRLTLHRILWGYQRLVKA
ncbi:hypothetical protein [Mycolicibacterium sphagni]|uniref:hypothetical protein n=1 Tax=Mycolicibacterium sphagni TaxID=1786 RepID=UPI0021F2E73C|nr:hypothetical protein [Mycolicibacterium sphagni]MCV7174864.1 hypothetical protein [Mycolicibacterium sphagni]